MRRFSPLLLLLACSVDEKEPVSEVAQPARSAQKGVDAPVHGGTMARADSGHLLFADPGAGVVEIVDATTLDQTGRVLFDSDARPSRIAVQGAQAAVVLRGQGRVAAIDVTTGEVSWDSWVCAEPRGIDSDTSRGEWVVACASGELVTVKAADGSLVDSVLVDSDLRDVVVQGDLRYVSRFRSAELLTVDRSGEILTRQVPPAHDLLVHEYNRSEPFVPGVAWRTVAHPDGGVVMLHQRTTDMPLEDRPGTRATDIADPEVMVILVAASESETPPYYGPPEKPEPIAMEVEVPYNGPDCRSPVTHSAVTRFKPDGTIQTSVPLLAGATPVDIAIHGSTYAIVAAGSNGGDGNQLTVTEEQSLFYSPWACLPDGTRINDATMTSVAFNHDQVVLGSRYPRSIDKVDDRIVLDTTQAPTGFALFHEDPGIGMSCASCHPEGQDDGHTWRSEVEGTRRTLRASGTLKQTAPYHWEGNHATLADLLEDTRVGRMNGYPVSRSEADDLLDFLEGIPTPKATPKDAELVESGRELFDDRGCAGCHSGELFTNNANEDIGKPEIVQTPSLVGVGVRTPLMRDGCADSLEERFTNAYCGGDKHGNVAPDETEAIRALVAYLETL